MSSRTVVIATPEPLGHRRAGPAVRAIRMAEAVAAAGHAVTLVGTDPTPVAVAPDDVTVVGTEAAPRDADVYIVTGRAMLDLVW
ncbi:MAG: hypothetical protein OES57_18505, partial [Acidimicrobiia bacterium]|nr:hypothetical protein [Acidimicrobiia bacterium]